jgi:hypothetical protein
MLLRSCYSTTTVTIAATATDTPTAVTTYVMHQSSMTVDVRIYSRVDITYFQIEGTCTSCIYQVVSSDQCVLTVIHHTPLHTHCCLCTYL